VLGAFALARDGEPVRFTGKTQARPLELLKFVVAAGSAGVDAEHVTSTLWPDADGAAAKSSFDSALFRLRKLLDVDDAIELASGQVTLGRSIVWTDVLALEAALEHAGDPAAKPALAARRLLDAYAGPLLGTDEAAWIAKPRDALRSRFVRKLMELGAALEAASDWTAAADVYRRGLEADNLVEPFYRGLMRALVATGSPSEALAAFRRCRELLSIVLGLEPSPETQRLYREIVRDARA
jgi:LuxR family transcriptional regulator, maltose regulon positive regulatory protein